MKPHRDGLDAYVRAFKEATAGSADMRATRARVLAAAGQRTHRRSTASRVLPIAVAGLVIGSSASAGVMSLAGRWRAPLAVAIEEERPALRPAHAAASAVVVIPAAAPVPVPAEPPDPDAAERAAYARAHVAHFDGTSWQRALTAWDDYLRSYPHGTFAPEARYNRAVCLIRLERFAAAKAALRPFAAGAVGRGYRAGEARTLLDWIDRPR
jgi:TolA-binding protein